MNYQLYTLLFSTVLAFVGASQSLPNEANIAVAMKKPTDPEMAWEGGRGYRHHKGKGKDMSREFEEDRSKKKTREFDERDRSRRRTWEKESGSDTSKSRDIRSRTGDMERSRREGRSRVRN